MLGKHHTPGNIGGVGVMGLLSVRCHNGLTIGHVHKFSSIQDWYFVIAWAGSG